MYTKAQMKMVCNYKVLGYSIQVTISDEKVEVSAEKSDRDVLLFVVTPEEHFVNEAI